MLMIIAPLVLLNARQFGLIEAPKGSIKSLRRNQKYKN
jgi:hypothetical protein